jgi:hypothetical protein
MTLPAFACDLTAEQEAAVQELEASVAEQVKVGRTIGSAGSSRQEPGLMLSARKRIARPAKRSYNAVRRTGARVGISTPAPSCTEATLDT